MDASHGNDGFKNPYIILMNALFIPDCAAFSHVDTRILVIIDEGEQVVVEKGYYPLAMLNEMTTCGSSDITTTNSLGCIRITTRKNRLLECS